ncbi:hypothetical protein [Photorhabdus sp. RM96S]|uniref:hypothetical protein n=1 Tax=Photorhabdus sp. RM96S TaxID=3342822 RepID=UPI0036DA3271
MFNLIMLPFDWRYNIETIAVVRVFEHTHKHVSDQFKQDGKPVLDRLIRLPCLFMQEGTGKELAYVGKINSATVVGKDISFEYTLDMNVPSMLNSMIYANCKSLDMLSHYEFFRNHWAVKDIDLYQFLFRTFRPSLHVE